MLNQVRAKRKQNPDSRRELLGDKTNRLMLEFLTAALMVANGVPVPPLIAIIFAYAVFRGMSL